MTRTLALALCLVAAAADASAQQPPAAPRPAVAPQAPRAAAPPPAPTAPTPPAASQPPAPRREGQPINVKIDVTLTDQRVNAAPIKKTVTVVAGDGMNGFIRTQGTYLLGGTFTDIPLNIDAQPNILTDGKVRLGLNLQYDLPSLDAPVNDVSNRLRKTQIHENLGLILESGKSIIAAQSADPVTDRQVIVEVKATILK